MKTGIGFVTTMRSNAIAMVARRVSGRSRQHVFPVGTTLLANGAEATRVLFRVGAASAVTRRH